MKQETRLKVNVVASRATAIPPERQVYLIMLEGTTISKSQIADSSDPIPDGWISVPITSNFYIGDNYDAQTQTFS